MSSLNLKTQTCVKHIVIYPIVLNFIHLSSPYKTPQIVEEDNIFAFLLFTQCLFNPLFIPSHPKQVLEEEVEVMTQIIETADRPRAYDYCRRGAIRRKLGHIGLAMEDLNTAIDMEPMMLDAFWHRHLINILLNKRQQALEDLNFIIKQNKFHAQAYKSR